MPYGKGTYGSKVGRPKKKMFKPCATCTSPVACKKAGKCLKGKK
jgi:hypothetical protein